MIGSISKSFAAIVVLQEVEAGRLDLHVSVNELLPWLELPEPFGPITMHHLLTHTSGLAAGTEDAPTGLGAATLLRDVPPTFAPGEHFWYSNDAYKLVGLVLERVRTAGARAHPPARVGAARDDRVGRRHHRGRPDRPGHGLRAGVHRPARAAPPPARSRDVHGLEHGGRQHRVERDRHGRARPAAAEPRHGTGGPVLSEAMFDVLTTPFVEQPDDPGRPTATVWTSARTSAGRGSATAAAWSATRRSPRWSRRAGWAS